MHALYLGVVLLFLNLWFNEKYNTNEFSLFQEKHKAEKMYLNMKIPHFKTRPPKKLENFTEWKAAELRYLIMYSSFN